MLPSRIQRLERQAAGWVESGTVPTLLMLAARKGVIFVHSAGGLLQGDAADSRVSLDSLYPLASVTKPVTATAAMMLVEQGLLRLNMPVAHYIPEFIGAGKEKVKVHHLMTHTSGLRGEEIWDHIEAARGTKELPVREDSQHPNLHETLTLGYDAPLWRAPGEEMAYCDYGIQLLGEMVRRIIGQSLAHFAAETIFQPLGMNDTYFIVPESERHRIVKHKQDGLFHGYPGSRTIETPSASSGLFSTVYDMAVFCQMFLNEGTYGDVRILSKASVRLMTRNHIPGIRAVWGDDIYPEGSWGLCWDIHGDKKLAVDLWSPRAYTHEGYGGSAIWVESEQ